MLNTFFVIGYSDNFGLVLRRLIDNHFFLNFDVFDVLIILFQLTMFMVDLQGEPKGLSIGGLAVITKSLSITVKYIELSFSNK